jgi:hypothetical protein
VNEGDRRNLRSLMEIRATGIGPKEQASAFIFSNTTTDEMIIALAEAPGEVLPPAALLTDPTTAQLVNASGTPAGTDANGNLKVAVVTPAGNAVLTDDADRLVVSIEHTDGQFSIEGDQNANILQVAPLSVLEAIGTPGTVLTTGYVGTPAELSAYALLVVQLEGLSLDAGATAKLGIEWTTADDGVTRLFLFQNQTAAGTGNFSVSVGRGLVSANLDTKNATFGARPLFGRARVDITGGPPTTAAGTVTFYGVRGAG